MNLMKIALGLNRPEPVSVRGKGRTHKLLEKALMEAANRAALNERGRVVFVCKHGLVPHCRMIVKKIMKANKQEDRILQWFQLWPLQRDLTSLQGTPHVFVLDHDVDCPEVRGAFSALGPGRVLL